MAAKLSADPTIMPSTYTPPLPIGRIPTPMRDEGRQAPRGFRHLGWYNYPVGGLLEGVTTAQSPT